MQEGGIGKTYQMHTAHLMLFNEHTKASLHRVTGTYSRVCYVRLLTAMCGKHGVLYSPIGRPKVNQERTGGHPNQWLCANSFFKPVALSGVVGNTEYSRKVLVNVLLGSVLMSEQLPST